MWLWECDDLSALTSVQHKSYDTTYNFICRHHPVIWTLSTEASKTVVQAFVSPRLDYRNSLLSDVTDSLVQRLQTVQNAAARLVTGICRCENITPVLRQLHWLPGRQRIEFKMAVLVYKSLNALSPRYLIDDWQLIATTGRRRLRSPNVATCDVPRIRRSLGDWSFTTAGPRLWNNLPVHLRDSELTLLEFPDYWKCNKCKKNKFADKKCKWWEECLP